MLVLTVGMNMKLKPFLNYLQANSPIRTLDELHVSEVISTAIFPSIMDRGLNNTINQNSPVISSIDISSKLGMLNGGSNVFGIRKKHRSYEVRARARSFLYHQVRIMPFHVLFLLPFFNFATILVVRICALRFLLIWSRYEL